MADSCYIQLFDGQNLKSGFWSVGIVQRNGNGYLQHIIQKGEMESSLQHCNVHSILRLVSNKNWI